MSPSFVKIVTIFIYTSTGTWFFLHPRLFRSYETLIIFILEKSYIATIPNNGHKLK